ncbi:MAG TPA: hypothetical protein VN744_09210, partial [Casimicrobiaceae bacterium]|nr:hypothetical protein [Casimicrobiaceae bacterium]
MPIGMPGWPELAFWTASIASARIALAIWVVGSVEVIVDITEVWKLGARGAANIGARSLLSPLFYQTMT